MLRDPDLAEDVAQETFVRVWRHAATFDARRGRVPTWVLAIARNLAIDRARLRSATPVDPEVLASELALAGGAGPVGTPRRGPRRPAGGGARRGGCGGRAASRGCWRASGPGPTRRGGARAKGAAGSCPPARPRRRRWPRWPSRSAPPATIASSRSTTAQRSPRHTAARS